MSGTNLQWLAADYHFATTYSCRIPLSSMFSALVSPAPGPATIRLALLRVGMELFGEERVRHLVFPTLRAARLLIRPPERVALTGQVVRAYKATEDKGQITIGETVAYREMAQAQGPMTIYVELPQKEQKVWEQLLQDIGYWGQTNSFVTCLSVNESAPLMSECVQPLAELSDQRSLSHLFSCVLSEFRDPQVCWQEVVPFDGPPKGKGCHPLTFGVYVWPLQIVRRSSHSTLLARTSLR